MGIPNRNYYTHEFGLEVTVGDLEAPHWFCFARPRGGDVEVLLHRSDNPRVLPASSGTLFDRSGKKAAAVESAAVKPWKSLVQV